MPLSPSLRSFLALGLLLLLGLASFVLLFVTKAVLEIWTLLRSLPLWVTVLHFALVAAFAALGVFLVYRVWTSARRRRAPTAPGSSPTPVADESQLRARIGAARDLGVAVEPASQELAELDHRRSTREIYAALFGSISVGKSALIRALLPDAEVSIDPRGGTTRQITHYRWQDPAGLSLQLTDLPGLHEVGGTLNGAAREEALRAHLVIYVCDGDLTREQYEELLALSELGKPLVLALNKTDRLTPGEISAIRERLQERIRGRGDLELAAISAGGEREVVRVHPDGREEIVVRTIPPRIEELALTLRRQLDRLGNELDTRRDRSLVNLGERKLESAMAAHRRTQADAIVQRYTRRAIVGALAAVTPGTDLLIQGYLGIRLVKELATLYERPAKDVSLERFIQLASKQLGRTMPLILAVSGNVLKAFPGLGTVTGSLTHAVAYGLIFDSLGRSVAMTLDQFGELETRRALDLFEEKLGEDLEVRARDYIRYALEAKRIRTRDQQPRGSNASGTG
jgi:GTPase SAR1 family protein